MKHKTMAFGWKYIAAAVLAVVTVTLVACQAGPTTPPVTYSVPELKYRLLSNFDDVFWTDPDFYPVAREGQEQKNAQEQFPAIRADEAKFKAILEQLNLPEKAEYTDNEKLQIYREHKKLTFAVQMTPSVDNYIFVLRVHEGQGERIEGTITPSGRIKVTKREPSINTHPICLARGTLIDTPDGPVAVEQLRSGMSVWTLDLSGRRVAASVIETVMTPVPPSFEVVRVTLKDGRTVTASPGHPTVDGRALGDYRVGDTLDGSPMVATERVAYGEVATYDILPSGTTGFYWANGILLMSTLAADGRN